MLQMHIFLQGACTTTVDLHRSHALRHLNSRSCRIVLFVLFQRRCWMDVAYER